MFISKLPYFKYIQCLIFKQRKGASKNYANFLKDKIIDFSKAIFRTSKGFGELEIM